MATSNVDPVFLLAMNLHEIHYSNPEMSTERKPWSELPNHSKARYLYVAKQLLLNPPIELRKRVRELEAL